MDGATSNPATVSVNVNAVNDAPVDGDETNTVTEDVQLDVPASTGLLANSTDVDGGVPSITEFTVGGTTFPVANRRPGVANLPGIGDLTINSDGSYRFAPALNYNGPVS